MVLDQRRLKKHDSREGRKQPAIKNITGTTETLKIDCTSDIATATAKSLQSCLTLCDPIDSSPPGSPVPGILQASTLDTRTMLKLH